MITRFHYSIEKGGSGSNYGRATLGVMGVLIENKGVFGRY